MMRSEAVKSLLVSVALVSLTGACGPIEVRISRADGIKPIEGSVVATLDTSEANAFKCGDTITATDPNQVYTVTTVAVTGGCRFVFDQDVEIFAEGDYAANARLKEAAHFVQRVELTISKLDFFDGDGTRFDVESRIRDTELWVNGVKVIDIDTIKTLPRMVVLEGEPLNVIKRAINNKQRCLVHVMAQVVVLDAVKPTAVRCDYGSQPTIVLSTTEV